jgi:hypothetical protein
MGTFPTPATHRAHTSALNTLAEPASGRASVDGQRARGDVRAGVDPITADLLAILDITGKAPVADVMGAGGRACTTQSASRPVGHNGTKSHAKSSVERAAHNSSLRRAWVAVLRGKVAWLPLRDRGATVASEGQRAAASVPLQALDRGSRPVPHPCEAGVWRGPASHFRASFRAARRVLGLAAMVCPCGPVVSAGWCLASRRWDSGPRAWCVDLS